jgi:hypothetical protein
MSYQVQPKPLSLSVPRWLRSVLSPLNFGCSGCLSTLAVLLLLWLAVAQALLPAPADFGSFFAYFLVAAVPLFLLLTFVLHVVGVVRRDRAEAQAVAVEANGLLQGLKQHADYLTARAERGAQILQRAEYELQVGATSPFWDAIEAAAVELAECRSSGDWMADGAARYDAILVQRNHDFPDCMGQIDELPDCRPMLADFYRLVRAAQLDFRFQMIWEQRQTRKVLIVGFASLSEAIQNLERTVAHSIARLEGLMIARTLLQQANPLVVKRVVRFFVPGQRTALPST